MTSEHKYVIVGSGIAATLVCDRLLEANPRTSILVLEAGEIIPSRDRRGWWGLVLDGKTPYQTTYDDDDETSPNRESFWTGKTKWGFRESRVRAYGGSTMHWGGWALRFKEEDFQCFENTDQGVNWPFGYDELEPWYALAEQVLSVGGNAKDEGPKRSGNYPLPPYVWTAHEAELAGALEKFDLKPGHMPIARDKRCMTTGTCKYCPIGARYSARDHLSALEHDPSHQHFVVKTEAPVRKILAAGNRATGVEYFDTETQDWTQVDADKVIVCAGTYESTKLLLASKPPGWPDGLGNKHDQLGRHIVTHLLFSVEGTRKENPGRLFQEYDFPTLMSRSWDTEERQADGKMFVFNNRSLPTTDFATMMIDCHDRDKIDEAAKGPSKAGLSAFIEEIGQFDNQLKLGSEIGKFRLPHTYISFTRRDEDRFNATVDRARKVLSQCLEHLGYACATGMPQYPRGDHASGTCRMGVYPDSSVTNADLAVHGVKNLFVCSNAVLPNAAAVNPTLTLAALALRLGARLGDGRLK